MQIILSNLVCDTENEIDNVAHKIIQFKKLHKGEMNVYVLIYIKKKFLLFISPIVAIVFVISSSGDHSVVILTSEGIGVTVYVSDIIWNKWKQCRIGDVS